MILAIKSTHLRYLGIMLVFTYHLEIGNQFKIKNN